MLNVPHPSPPSAEPTRAEVDAWPGPLMLEFGTRWCGHCAAAQPAITTSMATHPGVQHLKVEDGRGRPLGRSFGVKLWPTLVLLHQGRVLACLVRPGSAAEIDAALHTLREG